MSKDWSAKLCGKWCYNHLRGRVILTTLSYSLFGGGGGGGGGVPPCTTLMTSHLIPATYQMCILSFVRYDDSHNSFEFIISCQG
jgi:hypothetical protein